MRRVALFHRPIERGWVDRAIALGLAALYLALLLATVDGLGYARDEGFYFAAARAYEDWLVLLFASPDRALAHADDFWRHNAEHPPLVKTLMALSHHFLHQELRVFAWEGTSYRFPAMALSSLAVATSYLWGTRARGRLVGLMAAGTLGATPHFFFHAHLACFDAPVVATWCACAYAYWRALVRGGIGAALLVGVTFAIALATKHNAWFLPIACGLHAVALVALAPRLGLERKRVVRRAAAALASMATVGPLLFWASWPWLWREPLARFGAYARFHLEHVYYNMELFGRTYFEPPMPRSYAFVMTAATVPTITLCAFAIGLGACALAVWRTVRARSPRSELPSLSGDPATVLLWALSLGVQYAAWLRPTTPIFGGTKHWMTAYPFLALFAGVGTAVALATARRLWQRSLLRRARGFELELLFAASTLLPPLAQALHAHPWGLSAYVPIVGGASGAATLGLNRGFWGYTTGAITPYLNASPPGTRIYVHDTAGSAWDMLVADGRLRSDLRGVWRVTESGRALYHHEQHMQVEEYQTWVAYQTIQPDHVTGLDGVPILWVYRRP